MDAYPPPLDADRFDDEPVPVVPPAMGYLLSTLYDNNTSIKSLATEVERFPSIAARLLAVANSAWSAPMNEVTDLPDACTRLGLRLVRTLCIALAVANTFDPTKCPDFNGEHYWTTALLAAEGTTSLARGSDRHDDASAWRCGALFHNIGLLWLADRYPEETADALTRTSGGNLISRLRDLLGTDYCRAGARLASVWGLPASYVSIIAHHREPDAAGEYMLAAATVGMAADMAARVYKGEPWTSDGIPECARGTIRADVAADTWQLMPATLETTRTMGRMIARA